MTIAQIKKNMKHGDYNILQKLLKLSTESAARQKFLRGDKDAVEGMIKIQENRSIFCDLHADEDCSCHDDLKEAINQKADKNHSHDWNEITGKPTEFPSTHHSHNVRDIEGLDDVLHTIDDIRNLSNQKLDRDGSNATGSLASTINNNHNHVNKAILDTVTSSKVNDWDNAASKVHNAVTLGSNATGLTITNQVLQFSSGYQLPTTIKVSEWDDAYLKRHTHGNKTVLDNLTQSVIDQAHVHSNKSVIDGITTQMVNNWNGSFVNNHTHNNKSTLDAISSTDVTNWDAAHANNHTHTNKVILDAITAAYTVAEKSKLATVQLNAQANVKADWNATSGDAEILNKPTSFTPSSHNHAISDIAGLQSELDSKLETPHLNGFVQDVVYNSSLHTLTFYQRNEPNIVIDLPIEHLIKGVQLHGNDLVFTFEDGSNVTIPMNTLLVGVVKSVNGLVANSQGEVVLDITDIPGLQSILSGKANADGGNLTNIANWQSVLGINTALNLNLQEVTSNGNSTTNNIFVPQVITSLSNLNTGVVPTDAGIRLWSGSGNAQYGIAVNSNAGGMDIMANQAGAGTIRFWSTGDNANPILSATMNGLTTGFSGTVNATNFDSYDGRISLNSQGGVNANTTKIFFNNINASIGWAISQGVNYVTQEGLSFGTWDGSTYTNKMLLAPNGDLNVYANIGTNSYGSADLWYQGYLNSQAGLNLTWQDVLSNGSIASGLPIFYGLNPYKAVFRSRSLIGDNYISFQDSNGAETAYQGFGSGSNEDYTFFLRNNGVNKFQWYIGDWIMDMTANSINHHKVTNMYQDLFMQNGVWMYANNSNSNEWTQAYTRSIVGADRFTSTYWGDVHRFTQQNGSQFEYYQHGMGVLDTRNSRITQGNTTGDPNYLPNALDFELDRKTITLFNTAWGGSGWGSSIISKGWDTGYNAWMISGSSTPSDAEDDAFFRQSISSSGNWHPARRLWSTRHFSDTDIANWNTAYNNIGQLGNYALRDGSNINNIAGWRSTLNAGAWDSYNGSGTSSTPQYVLVFDTTMGSWMPIGNIAFKSWLDLSAYALTSAIPTNNNQLSNGAGYITSSALSGYASQSWVNSQGFLTSASLPNVSNATITYQGIGAITGGGSHTVNQSGNSAYNFDLTNQTKNEISLGVNAYNSLSSKQDALVAGSGISIIGNIINATGSGGGGIVNIATDSSVMPGPTASQVPMYFNSHVAYGLPETDIANEFPGNLDVVVETGDTMRFYGSYDNVYTVTERTGEIVDLDIKGNRAHIYNVVFQSSGGTGGTVRFDRGIYTGDQINITVPKGQQITIQSSVSIVSPYGNGGGFECQTHANLIWDPKVDAWILVSYD